MQERGRSGTSTLGFRSSLAFAARANKGKSCCNANVRFWHEADMSRQVAHVRFRGEADVEDRAASTASVVDDP